MSEPINDLGVIVNDRDGMDKSNDRSLNTDEAIIPIRVPNAVFDRMVKAAQFHQYKSVEDWAASTLVNSLTTKVGAPRINSPDQLNNQDSRLITGPSNSGMVRRG